MVVERVVLKSSATLNGCHFCHKSVYEMSAPLNWLWSIVIAIIVKWKRLRATPAQSQSGLPQKLTEQGHRVQKHVVHKYHLSSVALLIEPNCLWKQHLQHKTCVTDEPIWVWGMTGKDDPPEWTVK